MPAYQSMKPVRLLVLVAIGAVMIATAASFLARWKRGAGAPAAATVEPLTGDVDQQTKAFTLSKTDGDHTLYTIHAEQVTTLKESQKAVLHEVGVDIFGKTGARHDRITTAEAEYDPMAQTLWIPGAAEMNFELPPSKGAAQPGQRVSIHTSKLRFDQSTGIAATDEEVSFTFPQGEGQSRGARYDPQQQTLHLAAAVEFRLRNGGVSAGAASSGSIPTTMIHAGELRFVRDEARIQLDRSVEVSRAGQRLQALSGTILLNSENQVEHIELTGGVHAYQQSDALLAETQAGTALLEFNPQGAIQEIALRNNVRWKSAGGGKQTNAPQREGGSQSMMLYFAEATAPGDSGTSLERATASGNVRVALNSTRGTESGAATAGQRQVLTGQQAELFFAPGGKLLRDAKLRQSAKIELHSAAGGAPRIITADWFDFDFNAAGDLTQFMAKDKVRVTFPVSPGPVPATAASNTDVRITTSSELIANFDPLSGNLSTLRQSGDFTYQDARRRARAATALYQAEQELLLLERNIPDQPAGVKARPQAVIIEPEGRLSANTIRLFTASGDLEADGAVATTSTSAKNEKGSAAAEPVHAVANTLRYAASSGVARYEGKARLWQGTEFLLEAELAEWDRRNNTLSAAGMVLTIYRQTGSPGGTKENSNTTPSASSSIPSRSAGTYVIRSEKVSYFPSKGQAPGKIHYEGKVEATQAGGRLTANSLEIFLAAASPEAATDLRSTASRIEKMVGRGAVQLTETGRVGKGDTVEYLAENKKITLYGKPAILTDSERGSTKGVQLSYQIGDNSASVVGDGGERTETRWIPTR